ncbi:hypothetical protein QCE64_37245 [Caballeronia sp. LZ043]|nr:hypothetical protein [Caballeronia sp. LZ043]
MTERFIALGFTLVGAILIGLSGYAVLKLFLSLLLFCTEGSEKEQLSRKQINALTRRARGRRHPLSDSSLAGLGATRWKNVDVSHS